MKNTSIDIANIFLMIISAIAAFFIPFELFLFSYAVLGPLHYLTEISWLNQKKYYTKFKFDYLLLVIGAAIIFLISVTTNHSGAFYKFTGSLMFFAFFASLVMITVKDTSTRILLFIITLVASVIAKDSLLLFVVFAVLLPTVIHVFLFTGSFILHGAMRSKSKAGIISVFVFIACFLFLFFCTVDVHTFTLSSYVMNAYKSFQSVNLQIMNLLNIRNPNVQYAIYQSAAGLSIMRFIAFAYTYHYLNWFSKTKVIRWHLVPRRELIIIASIWIASVALYIYNYQIGLAALFFLSLLHVLLEFPLNHKTFIGIYDEARKMVGGEAKAA